MRALLRGHHRAIPRFRVLWLVAILSAAFPRQTAAGLLTPLADGRYVLVEHCPAFESCQSQSARPPSAFAAFDGEAASYTWTGAGAISGGGYGGAFLYDLTSDVILFETGLPADFEDSGVLAAGHRYRLFQHATALGRGSADWTFEFSALPEPDLALSLACALVLASLLARRRS